MNRDLFLVYHLKIDVKTTNLVICKGDESERSEGFRNENICNLPILHEELTELISGYVLCATAHKHFPAPHWFIWTLLLNIQTDHSV